MASGLFRRCLSTKGRSTSSNIWLQRQARDPFVKLARTEQYRSRSAIKLVQINDKFKFLQPGCVVVDLGAAPGGWSQVAARIVFQKGNQAGRVVGADILAIDPIPGVNLLQIDLRQAAGISALKDALSPFTQADVVLSDMAPSFSGNFITDEARHTELCEIAIQISLDLFPSDLGTLVIKVLQGNDEQELFKRLKSTFARVHRMKPAASRSESRELYMVAQCKL